MCVADQSASLATKIPTRRRESVPRAMYCTISNVMRRKYAQNPPMTVNPVRISILGPKVTTTSMKRSIKIHFYISTRKKHTMVEKRTLSCQPQGSMVKIAYHVKSRKQWSWEAEKEMFAISNLNGMIHLLSKLEDKSREDYNWPKAIVIFHSC